MIDLDNILSLIAPSTCVSCSTDGQPLCESCYLQLDVENNQSSKCIFCSKQNQGSVCRICNSQTGIDEAINLGEHKGSIKKLVWDLKFNSKKANIICLARYLELKLAKFSNCRVFLIPAPTAPKRARARGYDQAKLLARRISKANSNWFYKDILIRTKDYDQIGLSKIDRVDRTKNLFVLNSLKKINPENVVAVLIDDVVTTGSTIKAASRAISDLNFDLVVMASLSYKPLET